MYGESQYAIQSSVIASSSIKWQRETKLSRLHYNRNLWFADNPAKPALGMEKYAQHAHDSGTYQSIGVVVVVVVVIIVVVVSIILVLVV